MKTYRHMTDKYLAKEIESLSDIIDAMESGLIETELEEMKLLSEKRDGLIKLRDVNLRLTMAEAGVPYDIMLNKREKKVFFRLLKIYLKWTSLKRLFS